jgi:hypothetical protein
MISSFHLTAGRDGSHDFCNEDDTQTKCNHNELPYPSRSIVLFFPLATGRLGVVAWYSCRNMKDAPRDPHSAGVRKTKAARLPLGGSTKDESRTTNLWPPLKYLEVRQALGS